MTVNRPSAGFGELLRDHRRSAGMTQEQLAERAGVSPRSISELERGGAHIPRRDTVDLLARALSLGGADREAFEERADRGRRLRSIRPVNATTVSPVLPATHTAEAMGERRRHNLRRSLTSFVGREHELTELAGLLLTAPVLTLVGAGGVGKTRLAQELVRAHLASFPDGIWFVELAGLADQGLVPGAVATAVGLGDVHARNLTTALTNYLRSRRVLLVLDNCEHLVEACAQLVASLLRNCPNLQVLATSRERLAITGEITWRVSPLEVPDEQPASHEHITRTAAVRLFIERTQAVNHLLHVADNLPAIARICRRVDGIPLAIEIAAARSGVLTLEELADKLEGDIGVLGHVNRSAQPQHQTIRAMIDWSHDLLGEQEQVLLRRLSVFAGGSTLELAEQVCSGDGLEAASILDLLTQLVDKSLVTAKAGDATPVARYRLLEPIRQYALERLEASGEAAAYRARHAATFLALALEGEARPTVPDEIPSLHRLDAERDNLRAALTWALTHQQTELALRASGGLFRFWERRGYFQEGSAWLEQALASADQTPTQYRGRALNALATLYWRGAEVDRAEAVAEQALAVNRAIESTGGVAWSLINLGMIAYFQGRADLALARLEEGVPYARLAGYNVLLSLALTFLGRTVMWVNGPLDAYATALLAESLAIAETSRSRTAISYALMTCGDAAWRRGDVERAIGSWHRALMMRWEIADRRGIADSLERLAWGLATTRQFEAAAWLFGAGEAQRSLLGIELRNDEQSDHLQLVAATRQHLGEAFASGWSAGHAGPAAEAVKRALQANVVALGQSEPQR